MIDEVRIEVARVFFALPESNGYAIGGGVAALAHRIVERTTDDLDLFTDRRQVQARPLAAAKALATAAHDRNWRVEWIWRYPDYARLLVTTEHASLLVDLALETIELPPTLTVVGPTIAEQDVAVGKLIAQFDRGPQDLAERLRRLTEQLTEADLTAAYQDRFEEIRSFYAEWRTSLLGRLLQQGARQHDLVPRDVQTGRMDGSSLTMDRSPPTRSLHLPAPRGWPGPHAGEADPRWFLAFTCPNWRHVDTAEAHRSRVLPGQR